MSKTVTRERRRKKTGRTRARRKPSTWLPWKLIFLATVPIGLGVYYLCWVAPGLVPVPGDLKVPFPAVTRWLEPVCTWCGAHPREVALTGGGLLLAGIIFRIVHAAERYYVFLTIVTTLALGLVYLSISAPIDRLIGKIESSIPKDERVPTHHSGQN